MVKISRALLCCAVAGCGMAGGMAKASTAQASASISNYHVELIDLNPADAIAPSITYSNTNRTALVRYLDDSANLVQQISTFGEVDLSPASGSVHAGMSPTAVSAAVQYDVPTLRYMSLFGEARYDTDFTLSPYTAVRFIGNGTVAASFPTTGQYNTANITMTGGFQAFDGALLYENQYFTHVYTMYGTERTYAMQGYLSTDDQSRTGRFTLSANSSAWLNPAPVPEPSSYLMLLSGVLVLGPLLARARKSRHVARR